MAGQAPQSPSQEIATFIAYRARNRDSPRPWAGPRADTDAVRRELHDVVGATLAGMATQLELASRLAGDRQDVQGILDELRTEATELIAHVRRLAHGDADTFVVENPEKALRTMIARMNRAVAPRLAFTLDLSPAFGVVPVPVRSDAFWITREAVVNVLKHSTARHCLVSVALHDGALAIRVEDDGTARRPAAPAGIGLITMAARAARHGGWCRAARQEPRGFAVAARLPLHVEVP